ncbi:MAG TPA: DegV family protein [Acidimicrobiales bacterium]|jgi:DegV family protein with EDD domain|nr:DegV family protein [Acidimicrobiales bacterium]
MIGFCTDSNAQIPATLVERFGVEVVPLSVTVGDTTYREGIDLDADGFYELFAGGAPQVATAAPAPGAFVEAFTRLAERGADEIVSVHIGSSVSATFNSARIAAGMVDVPVRLVDTGTASFAITACLWEAATAVAAGASVDEAVAAAVNVAGSITNVFVVQALDLPAAGGRLAAGVPSEGIPVLTLAGGQMRPIGAAHDVDGAAQLMADAVTATAPRVRVGLGIADARAATMTEALERRLQEAPEVVELVRYRIGPSVGAHTGPGAAGAIAWPASSGS